MIKTVLDVGMEVCPDTFADLQFIGYGNSVADADKAVREQVKEFAELCPLFDATDAMNGGEWNSFQLNTQTGKWI